MNFLRVFSFGWALIVFVTPVFAQESDRTELIHTKRLSKRFPDSAFLLLKEMYSKAIAGKDMQTVGTCLQQMGQICYYPGNG